MSTTHETVRSDTDQSQLPSSQTLYFNNTVDWKSEMVTASDVLIVPGDGSHVNGSSRVKVRSMVDSAWDRAYTWGNLVACHHSGEYFAYAVKVPGKTEGMVRVIHTSGNNRLLLKGFRGQVRDLAFAFHKSRVIVASIDEFGLVLVHEIAGNSNQLICQIEPNVIGSSTDYCRVVWCQYLPDASALDSGMGSVPDQNDRSLLLGAIHDNVVEIWDLSFVGGIVRYDSVETGAMTIRAFQKPVLDASFAPDGTAIALAGLDGYVRFFTVSLDKQEPSTLHEWKPHDGKPVTSINFLDNWSNPNLDNALWKSVITSTDFCTELKIWSCETWTPYQTIRFQGGDASNRIMQKVYLDLSASFLLVTDPARKVMYVMQIDQDEDGYRTKVSRITQLLLSFSPVSLAIRKAEIDTTAQAITGEDDEERELALDSGDGNLENAVLLDFYVIQPKSLQRCKALLYPEALSSSRSTASLPQSSAAGSLNTTSIFLPDYDPNKFSGATLNLLTPEAFISPSRSETAAPKPGTSPLTFSGNLSELLCGASPREKTPVPPAEESAPENGLNSGESSPSREVEEILGNRPITEGGLYEQPTSPEPQTAAVSELQEAAAALASPGFKNNEAQRRETLSAYQDQFTERPTEPTSTTLTVTTVNPNATSYLKDILSAAQGTNGAWPTAPLPRISSGRASEQPVPVTSNVDQGPGSMQRSFSEMVDIMKTLQPQIGVLCGEINRLKTEVSSLQAELSAVQSSSTPAWFPQLESQLTLLFDRELKKQKNLNNQAKILQTVTKLEQTLKTELDKKSSTPDRALLEILRQDMTSAIGGQMVRLESSVRDTVAQLLPQVFRDKVLMDSYGQAVASITTNALNKAVRDAVATQLAPAFERCCSSLYSQLHATFNRGIDEFLRNVQGNLEIQRHNNEKLVSSQLTDMANKMAMNTNQNRDLLLSEMNNRFAKLSNELSEQITSKISSSLHAELQRGFLEQKAALQRTLASIDTPARVATPVSVNSIEVLKSHLNTLIQKGDFLEAFQRALSASDLMTVLYVCERVNPQQLFASSPCPLPQPVLLSLIQQLSADLGSNTELKLSYLEEAILFVDLRDKLAKEHAPAVMQQLIRQLQSQTLLTTGPLNRKLRMLMLAAQQIQSS